MHVRHSYGRLFHFPHKKSRGEKSALCVFDPGCGPAFERGTNAGVRTRGKRELAHLWVRTRGKRELAHKCANSLFPLVRTPAAEPRQLVRHFPLPN